MGAAVIAAVGAIWSVVTGMQPKDTALVAVGLFAVAILVVMFVAVRASRRSDYIQGSSATSIVPLLPRLRLDAAQRLRGLESLRLLHESGTHFLLNPATADLGRLEQLRNWWEDRVKSEAERAASSPQAMTRFKTLTDVSDRGFISDKLRALNAIIDEVQQSLEKYVDSVKERLSAYRDSIVSAVSVDHITKTISIAMRNCNVSPEQTRVYLECKVEFLSLGYRVSGWPGDD